MLRTLIATLISNFFLTLYLVGFIVAAGTLFLKKKPLARGMVVEALFANYLLLAIGLSFLLNFVFHTFFGEMSARFIGWADSPFQLEVGFASLGFALVGLLAWKGSYGLRVGAVVGPAAFLLGAAGGHVYQMVTAQNFAPGNAGAVFWMDIVTPLTGFLLLWLSRPKTP